MSEQKKIIHDELTPSCKNVAMSRYYSREYMERNKREKRLVRKEVRRSGKTSFNLPFTMSSGQQVDTAHLEKNNTHEPCSYYCEDENAKPIPHVRWKLPVDYDGLPHTEWTDEYDILPGFMCDYSSDDEVLSEDSNSKGEE